MKRKWSLWVLVFSALSVFGVSAQQIDKYQPKSEQKATVSVPRTVPAYTRLAELYFLQKDHDQFLKVMEELEKMRPLDTDIRYRLATAYTLKDDKTKAFDTLLKLMNLGLSYDISGEEFANIKGYGLYDHLLEGYQKNREPQGEVQQSHHLQNISQVAPLLAFSSERNDFVVISNGDGQIYTIDDEGKIHPFFSMPEDNLLAGGLFYDEKSKALWLVANSKPSKNVAEGRSYILQLDNSGKLLRKVVVEHSNIPVYLADIAVADNGDLFLLDLRNKALLRLPVGKSSLENVLSAKDAEYLSAMAISKDGKVYLADISSSITVIDLKKQEASQLTLKAPFALNGISHMSLVDNSLYIAQTGITPARIMKLELDKEGKRVDNIYTLASGLPEVKAADALVPALGYLFYLVPSEAGSEGIRLMYTSLGKM